MLTILGRPQRHPFCDGLKRRDFLKIGGLAMGGLALPELLRAEAAAGIRGSHKAVIMIFLPGGPPHQDFLDLKPDAPAEVRGEFSPIKTNVSGIEICELMPRLAAMMDKLVVIRSIVGATGDHYAFQCLTGRTHRQQPAGGDRKSTRLNSSHLVISYAVFCLKKKKIIKNFHFLKKKKKKIKITKK